MGLAGKVTLWWQGKSSMLGESQSANHFDLSKLQKLLKV